MNTFKLIETIEVGVGGASSIAFSNIPTDGTYTDIKLVISGRSTQSNTGYGRLSLNMALNGLTTGFTGRDVLGFGSSGTGSTSYSTGRIGWIDANDATANTFSSTEVTIVNYVSNNAKVISCEMATENNLSDQVVLGSVANLWSNTAAVNSITLSIESGYSFAQGSTASLYGIKRVALPTPTDVYSDSLLEEIVLTSDAASVTFSNLNTYAALGYTNLQIRSASRSTRSASTNDSWLMTFNGDTGANYSRHHLKANGSSVVSEGTSSRTSFYVGDTTASSAIANTFGVFVIDILDAFDTSKYSTMKCLAGSQSNDNDIRLSSGAWLNTASLSSITLLASGGSLAANSRFSLYGSK